MSNTPSMTHAKKVTNVANIDCNQQMVSSVVTSIKTQSNIQQSSGNEKVLFSIEDPEHDMSTYLGRFKSFRKICNPFIAFYSNSKIIEM